MGLVNAGSLMELVKSYRMVWIGGRFGGGKTSLSYVIAEHYLRQGYRLVTNNRCVWADDTNNVQLEDAGKLKAVVLLDEGGLYFKASKQIEQICAYAAKMDVIYLLPTFFPPAPAARVLTIQPVYSLMSAGIPLIVYRWRVKLGAWDDAGGFAWWYPRAIYGIYSRQDPGSDPQEIIDWLVCRMGQYREVYGHGNELPDMGSTVDGMQGGNGVSDADIIYDAAASFTDAADTISRAAISKRGRKR